MYKLPKPIEPEYKSWPLEKLQEEYWRLSLKCTSLELQAINTKRRVELVDDFLLSFKLLVEHDKEE